MDEETRKEKMEVLRQKLRKMGKEKLKTNKILKISEHLDELIYETMKKKQY